MLELPVEVEQRTGAWEPLVMRHHLEAGIENDVSNPSFVGPNPKV